jgi:hypothetical protein
MNVLKRVRGVWPALVAWFHQSDKRGPFAEKDLGDSFLMHALCRFR